MRGLTQGPSLVYFWPISKAAPETVAAFCFGETPMPENTGQIRADHATRFQPGNPGKPKGARHALTEAFVKALHDDFLVHGPTAIVSVRADKPDQYLKVIASLVPKDVNLNVSNTDELSDAELAERIRDLAAQLAPFIACGTGSADASDENAGGAQVSPRVH